MLVNKVVKSTSCAAEFAEVDNRISILRDVTPMFCRRVDVLIAIGLATFYCLTVCSIP